MATEKSVIIIDDEEMVREVLCDLLDDMQVSHKCFELGSDAVAWFKNTAEDTILAIVDIMMPDMNGVETIRNLRAVKPDLKAFICSGSTRKDARERFEIPEDVEFIEKPFNFSEIEEKIKKLL